MSLRYDRLDLRFRAVGSLLKPLGRDARGNVALFFAFTAFIIALSVGVAVDISRVASARRAFQDAADAAVLQALQIRTTGTSTGNTEEDENSDKEREVDRVFDENIKTGDVFGIHRHLKTETINNTIQETYTVSGKVTSLFGGMIGMDYYPFEVVSKAQSSMSKSEIAFVLDVTGSMANDNRMVNLKSSVDAVLGSLVSTGTNVSGTKVAIVPFNTQVRIAQGTNYNFIDYGTQSLSEACNSLNSYICTAVWDTLDKVCISASDMNACRSTAKGYYKSTVSGNTTTYNVTYKAYVANGSGYTVYQLNQTFKTVTTTSSYGPGQNCNSETGICTPYNGGTSNNTAFSFVTRSSSTSNTTNLSTYNSAVSGYTAVTSSNLKYNVSNSNGYGANLASVTTATTYGSTRKYVYPAQTDTKANWNGCIIDRAQPYDTQADAPSTATPATLYPARGCTNTSLKPVQALSDNISSARTFVQSLQTGGNTNVTIGVQWGMEVLSPSDPMSGGVAFNDDSTKKYMIVVTDGLNTQNRFTSNTTQIDARTALACTNAKARGITIFVVRVMEGNSDLLRACASKADYFYDLTSASQLNTALASVFDAIKKTRITQ